MPLRDGRIFHVPLDVATKPAEGHAYVNRWWSVHPEKGVAFYVRERPARLRTEEPSPQCNTDRRVVEHTQRRVSEGHEARFLPVVYAAHAIEYQRLSKPPSRENP